MTHRNTAPLTMYLLEKRAALPPAEQSRALAAKGDPTKKKKGMSGAQKALLAGGALALGLGTGQVQKAGKLLKGVVTNPTTKKFDPVGAVKRGWRDMGNAGDSVKAIQNRGELISKGLQEGKIYDYTGGTRTTGLTNWLRQKGILSKGNKFMGTAGERARANIQAGLKKEMPHLFDDAGKLKDLSTLSPEESKKAYEAFQRLAKQQQLGAGTALQRANLGMYLPGEKAVIGTMTGMGMAGELGTTHDPSGRKRSLSERLIRAGAVGTAGVALNPLFANPKAGLIGGMLAFEAGNRMAGAAGGLAGRGATAATGGEFGSPVEEIKSHTPFMGGGH